MRIFSLFRLLTAKIITKPVTGIQRVLDDHGKVDASVKVWTINQDIAVPAQETLYWCTMHKVPRPPRKKGHIIGFNLRYLNEDARTHLHHFLIYRCYPPRGGPSAWSLFKSSVGAEGEDCLSDDAGGMNRDYCTEFTYILANGGRSHFHPSHIGFPLESGSYYVFQVHLDNPDFLQNKRVRIAVYYFYTEE